MSTFRRAPGLPPALLRAPGRLVTASAAAAGVIVVSVVVASRAQAPGTLVILGAVIGVGVTIWMFLSERVEAPLAILLLYLLCLDGFVKLSLSAQWPTLVRDVFLYAICIGWLARAALRGQRLRFPPLSGWVLAFVVAALVQLLNPNNTGLTHTVGALRPHLEFVPLFFVGYLVLQTRKALRVFFLLILVGALANGIVNVIQVNLTPEQLSSWGPGYAAKVNGTGDVAGRTFTDDSGQGRVRPFGLGGDSGAGAVVGLLGLGAALAMSALAARRASGRVGLVLAAGVPMALIAGQQRSLVIAAVLGVLAFTALATSVQRLIPTIAGVLLGIGLTVAVVVYISSTSYTGVFDRYATVSPGNVASETQSDRGSSIARIPKFIVQLPVGNGLGSVGPATDFGGRAPQGGDGETEFTYLLTELGIPGLISLLGLNLALIWLGVTRIGRFDAETRVMVAGLLTGVVTLFVIWLSASVSATSPNAPFFWASAGALAYWLTDGWRSHPARETHAPGHGRPAAVA